MKKLFAISAVILLSAACNNSSEESTVSGTDTLKASESPLMDAVNIADSASKIMQESTHQMTDTTSKK
jgi:uncharacterized protein YcfL